MSTHPTPPAPWLTRGFDAFRTGIFGNAGQNLYVSRRGILQRIFQFDLNQDGWIDLLFCNAQNHWEQPPAYIYSDVLGHQSRRELPSDGAVTGCVADLNGDGFDDLILGMEANGVDPELNAFIYYGSPQGLSQKHHARLPAPRCSSIAAGDFNGDGQIELACACRNTLRLFATMGHGFDARRFTEPGIPATHLAAADLDGDGRTDLYVIDADLKHRIYWGGKDGLHPTRFTPVEPPKDLRIYAPAIQKANTEAEAVTGEFPPPLARILTINNEPHLFLATDSHAVFIPVRGRTLGAPLLLPARRPVAAAVGDINGNGISDLVIAATDQDGSREVSWIYWGSSGGGGFNVTARTALPTARANDVAVGDLNDDGCAEIVFCQDRDVENYTIQSPLYRGRHASPGVDLQPVLLETCGARRVFITRSSTDPRPQVVFVNQVSRNAVGRVDARIYWNSPHGFDPKRFTPLPGLGAVSGAPCDFDDDGHPDLLLCNCAENAIPLNPGSFLYKGGPTGFTQPGPHRHALTLPTDCGMGIAIADINRDGYLDAIFTSFRIPEVLIYFGNENGFDTANPQRILMQHEGIKYTEGRRMCLADFNNDGYLDLFIGFNQHDRAFLLWGGPDGFDFSRKQVFPVIRGATPVAADLTGNGYLDLIIGGHQRGHAGPHDSWVYIYWNGPDGLREDRRTQLPANAVLGITLADFNRDGHLDMFVANYANGRERDLPSYLYWNAGAASENSAAADGPFSATRRALAHLHSAAGVLAADFDEDGYIDLAIANHKTHGDHRGESYVVWNGPNGLDFSNPTRLPTDGPHGMYCVQPGNIADRGDEEYYLSVPFQMAADAAPASIHWEAQLGPKTWVRAQLRCAAAPAHLRDATWCGHKGPNTWCEQGQSPRGLAKGPWLQYRLALGARNSGSTPRISAVEVRFAQ